MSAKSNLLLMASQKSFLSITTLKDGNGSAPCRNSGFEPSLFTIIKEGVSLNPKDRAKSMSF